MDAKPIELTQNRVAQTLGVASWNVTTGAIVKHRARSAPLPAKRESEVIDHTGQARRPAHPCEHWRDKQCAACDHDDPRRPSSLSRATYARLRRPNMSAVDQDILPMSRKKIGPQSPIRERRMAAATTSTVSWHRRVQSNAHSAGRGKIGAISE